MQLRLKDGTELNRLLDVRGGTARIAGAEREFLTFVFPATVSMQEMMEVFSDPQRCSQIWICTGEEEFVHMDYVHFASLQITDTQIAAETADEPKQWERRLSVTMGKKTYSEKQLDQAASDALLALSGVAELYEQLGGAAV